MQLPARFLLDTNVPKVANLALQSDPDSDIPLSCIAACLDIIENAVVHGGLVLDDGNFIYDEYRGQLALKGQPGAGDKFMKWVHDNRWNFPEDQSVSITPVGKSFKEFPEHEGLENFDLSDRKFVAVSHAHPKKPPIYQAADSKWWGWKDSLQEVGITVHFICPDYIEAKYKKKMD